MPCVSLNSRKIYKAKVMKSRDNLVKAAEPVSVADLSYTSPETENLVNIATVAEEVLHSEQILSNPQTVPITSAGVKPPRQPLYYRIQSGILRPAQTKALRRAVTKALHSPTYKATTQKSKALSSTPSAKSISHSDPQILLDGTKVQIRAHRAPVSRVGQKIIQGDKAKPAPAGTKSTRKSARLFKKTKKVAHDATTKATLTARQFRRRPSRAELINAESKLGSTIFGPVPEGHRREFFHDRENVWIWHEDWTDYEQHARQLTVRYEVRPSGVYKKISAGKYVQLKGAELENFRQATKVYLHVIKQKLYAHAK